MDDGILQVLQSKTIIIKLLILFLFQVQIILQIIHTFYLEMETWNVALKK